MWQLRRQFMVNSTRNRRRNRTIPIQTGSGIFSMGARLLKSKFARNVLKNVVLPVAMDAIEKHVK